MFRNREEAARLLARRFDGRELHDPLVLAIPRGGVATGAVLARELGAELDVVLSRKLRAPFQPELAFGAVAEDGRVYFNPRAKELLDLVADYIARERAFQLGEIARRMQAGPGSQPDAALVAEAEPLRRKMASALTIMSWLLILSATTMAIARYV